MELHDSTKSVKLFLRRSLSCEKVVGEIRKKSAGRFGEAPTSSQDL